MSKKTLSILLLILGIISIIFGFGTAENGKTLYTIFYLAIGIALIIWSSRTMKTYKENAFQGNNNKEKETKICKYCKSEIQIDAKVCPNCRKTLNFSIGRVAIGLVIGFAILYFVFVANNDAPVKVREFVCNIGLRDDYPYCYYVNTDKLDEILNNY